jgi:hypothetical protein
MKKQVIMWHRRAFVAVLASCGLVLFVRAGPAKEDAPKPLPPEIVKTWRDAGAKVGWMKDVPPRREGYEFWEPWCEKDNAGAVPAFRFHPDNGDVLDKLPDPGVAFGLDFHCTAVSDSWAKKLARLKSLRSLNVGASLTLTDAGVKELAALTHLRGLSLFYVPVTDAGLKDLTALKNLQALDLSYTRVTDAGLKELESLKNLQALNLGATKVTDVGLKALVCFRSLRWLNLSRTEVTAAGVAALQKALSECKIEHK